MALFVDREVSWQVKSEVEIKPFVVIADKDGQILLFEEGPERLGAPHNLDEIRSVGLNIPNDSQVGCYCNSEQALKLKQMGGIFLHPDLLLHPAYANLTSEDFRRHLNSFLSSNDGDTHQKMEMVVYSSLGVKSI
jgi:hypothetical protein